MKRWNLKNDVELLSTFNPFGLEFFDQINYLNRVSEVLEIDMNDLVNLDEGLYAINYELCSKSIYKNDRNRQRNLTKVIAPELLRYLLYFDESKHSQYKIKTNRGFIQNGDRYCPTLLDKNNKPKLGSIRFYASNLNGLIEEDYWDITSTYGNPRRMLKYNWIGSDGYECYENLKIINV